MAESNTLLPGLLPVRSTSPELVGDGHGAIISTGGRYVRNAVAAVFESLGGADGLECWVRSSPARLDTFYEKIAPKLIVKEVQVDDRRSVDDVILELDGHQPLPPRPAENVVDAEYESPEDYE